MRLRRSGMRKTLANFSNIEDLLLTAGSLGFASGFRWRAPASLTPAKQLNLATGLGDLLLGRLGKLMCVNRDWRLQVAIAQHLHKIAFGNHAALSKKFRIHNTAFSFASNFSNAVQVHHRVFHFVDVGAATLRQTAMQRYRAPFKAAQQARARALAMALLATRRSLA